MKKRTIKKNLPKHQIKGQVELNQQIGGVPLTMAQPYQNPMWAPLSQELPVPAYTTPMYKPSTKTELTKTAPSIVPIKKYGKNQWIPADYNPVAYGIDQGLEAAQRFLNKKPVKQVLNGADSILNTAAMVSPFVQMLDNANMNKNIERAYRDSLTTQVPDQYAKNRGDYEINTGMVDPYNTGAKSKGQYANAYYAPTMQDGGTLTLGPISFSDQPVFRDVRFREATPSRNAAVSTYVKPPVTRSFSPSAPSSGSFKETIAARESGGNYRALPKDKSGKLVSSAAGKYQFLWNQHKDWISKVTGVKSKQEFLNNPDAQERAFDYWDQTVLTPNAQKIKQQLRVPDSIEQIKAKIHFAGPGGAYNFYSTGQETTDAFGTTTSTYEDGGETINPMKIRIVKAPSMEYGGQMGYGLDLGGRRVYTDMPESTQDTVSNTMGPVPEEMATIEAEKGETILTDVDGDGMKEHMKIGGKRHSEGGTPLAAEPGDFVFSDTKKMKINNPRILALFNKSGKKGYTPAEIAKQYDMNKYKAILQDPNADKMSKRTAEMMLANYEQKLGLLSVVQEAKKGFPAGIPSVAESVMPEAKYGGYLEQYQTKGQVTPAKKSKAEFDAAVKAGQFKVVGNRTAERTWKEKVKDAVPGQEAVYETRQTKAPGKGSDAFNRAFAQARKAGVKEFTFNGKKFNTGIYVPGQGEKVLVKQAVPGQPEVFEDRVEQITYDEPKSITPPSVTTTSGDQNIPYAWTQQDKNNAFLALTKRGRVQKFSSVRPDVNPVMADFRNMDWRGKAAELQGMYNSQMNTLGTYQSPTSLAANASFMAGQQAENLINRAIDPTEQANVNIYNQVAGQNAAVMNQAQTMNAQNKFLRSQDRAILNQNYINALNEADSGVTQAVNQGITNASNLYNMNITESPYYYYDPRFQTMKFNSPNAKAEFEASIRNAGPSDGDLAEQYLKLRNKLTGVPEDQRDDVARELMGLGRGGGRASQTTYPFNPRMNRTTVQQPMTYPGFAATPPFMPQYNTYPQGR